MVKSTGKLACNGDSSRGSLDEFWFYDNQERLIMDSIYEVNPMPNSKTTYFFYQGDSIIVVKKGGVLEVDTMTVRLNQRGLPVYASVAIQKGHVTYLPTYANDGRLKKISRATIDSSGKAWYITIDSIVYEAGNIITYRSKSDLEGQEQGVIYCSYYVDKFYKQDYDPGGKILALSKGMNLNVREFNVQPFCKNLLKSSGNLKDFECKYEYELDNEGKVFRMNCDIKNRWAKWTNRYDLNYSCK